MTFGYHHYSASLIRRMVVERDIYSTKRERSLYNLDYDATHVRLIGKMVVSTWTHPQHRTSPMVALDQHGCSYDDSKGRTLPYSYMVV